VNNLALDKITIDQPSPPLFDLVNKRKPSEIVAMRGSELPGIVGLPIRALFPELPTPIWTSEPSLGNTDLDAVRERTLGSIRKVDWSKIQRGDTVNLLANPHGFFIAGEDLWAILRTRTG